MAGRWLEVGKDWSWRIFNGQCYCISDTPNFHIVCSLSDLYSHTLKNVFRPLKQIRLTYCNCYVQVTPWYACGGTERRRRYSFNPFATSALEGGGRSAPHPGRFTSGKEPVLLVQEAEWTSGPVWMGTENLAPTGIRSPGNCHVML